MESLFQIILGHIENLNSIPQEINVFIFFPAKSQKSLKNRKKMNNFHGFLNTSDHNGLGFHFPGVHLIFLKKGSLIKF